jgi:hypothetical protein
MYKHGVGLETAFEMVLLAIGCAIAYVSWGYGFGSLAQPGPGLYPFFVGLAIAAFAAMTLQTPREGSAVDNAGRRTLVVMSATFCFWVLAMPVLGYALVTFVATYLFCKALKLEGWRKPLALSGGTAVFIFLLFDYWLYIDLPRGIFG